MTDYYPSGTSTIFADFSYISTANDSTIFGVNDWVAESANMRSYINGSGSFAYRYGDRKYGPYNGGSMPANTSRHTTYLAPTYAIFDSSQWSHSNPYQTGQCIKPLGIACMVNRYGSVDSNTIGRVIIYSIKTWNNGVMTSDFIPARRKKDNAVGLYEKILDKFYQSYTSSYQFDAGPVVGLI